jgi:hypothetical protein
VPLPGTAVGKSTVRVGLGVVVIIELVVAVRGTQEGDRQGSVTPISGAR